LPLGTVAGIVVIQDEFWSIIFPLPQYPLKTVPLISPDWSILNHLRVLAFTPVQVVPGQSQIAQLEDF